MFSCAAHLAAQDFQYTQFNFSPFKLNPGFIGENSNLTGILHYRSQRINSLASYNTSAFTVFAPVYRRGQNNMISVGLHFMNDEFVGESTTFQTTRIAGALAYRVRVNRKHSLLFGIQFNYNQQQFIIGNYSTGLQYIQNLGVNQSLNNGETNFKNQINYIAWNPGIVYQTFAKDSSLRFQLSFSIQNFANNFKGFSQNSPILNPALALETKVNAFKIQNTAIFPEILVTYGGGIFFSTFGVVGSQNLGNTAKVDLGLWYSTNQSLAASLQIHLKKLTLGTSYQNAFNNNEVKSFGNNFELLVAYKQPINFKNKVSISKKVDKEEKNKKITSKNEKKQKKPKKKYGGLTVGTSDLAKPNIIIIEKKKSLIQINTSPIQINFGKIDTILIESSVPKITNPDRYEFDIDGKVYAGTLGEPLYFPSGKSELNESSFEELDNLIQYLSTHSQSKIFIFGHTDDIGLAHVNKKISQSRAAEVKKYLMKNGIAIDRIFDQGHGHEKPLHPNDNEENRAKNRRVELVLFK